MKTKIVNPTFKSFSELWLGHQYDHNALEIVFEWKKDNESNAVYFKIDGVREDGSGYMIPLSLKNSIIIQNPLTLNDGSFACQLAEYGVDGSFVKSSDIFTGIIEPSIEDGETPEVTDPTLDLLYLEYKQIFDRVIDEESNLVSLIETIQSKLDRGDFQGKDGNDGFSPSASVSKVGNKSTIEITDKNGTTRADVLDGKDGNDYILTDADKEEIADLVPKYDDTEIKQDISDLQEEDISIRQKISEIEMAKFPNVTIIGQPTINQGQISNFSSSNYCQFPFVVNFQNQRFLIDFEFTTGSDVSNQHNILDSNFGLAFAVRQNRFVVAISTNGTNWDVGEGVGTHVVAPNTTYRIKMAWNGTDTFTLSYSEDGGQSYVVDITKTLTSQPYPKQMYIGISYDKTHNFNGIVNLNYARLTIADTLVWIGMGSVDSATRLAIDLSNIDIDGVEKVKEIVDFESNLYIDNEGYICLRKGAINE